MTSAQQIATNSLSSGKIAAAFTAMVMMAVVAMTGVAGAASVPTSKADCKNGGWEDYSQFDSQKECTDFVKAQANAGYGGGNNNHVEAPNIVVQIRDSVVGAVNVSVNYVINIFN